MQKKNIFVLGLDEASLPTLENVPGAGSYRFRADVGGRPVSPRKP
ncbi:hypothetical protein [Streptomyces griseus]|nr:hypothetical protein [Streptomyces griseus]